ncbi:MAG TPA: hypothetical protein VGQ59_09125 [Cyclobacteriaceae bacterium]|jgi:hypothetical protein|nr:hypothetical protein [Cyclobacteriaceae bacterium]
MKNVVIVLMICILIGCEHSDIRHEKPTDESENYLPLKVGNYWNLEITDNSLGYADKIHREVAATATINNHEYYLLITSSAYDNYTYKDSSYYRIDPSGFVYIYQKAHPNYEDNLFRLNGNDQDSWSYTIERNNEVQIKLTVESVTLGNTEITKCKSYFYNAIQWEDEEYTTTLAPGIGFVKDCGFFSGVCQELKSARINGHVYNF